MTSSRLATELWCGSSGVAQATALSPTWTSRSSTRCARAASSSPSTSWITLKPCKPPDCGSKRGRRPLFLDVGSRYGEVATERSRDAESLEAKRQARRLRAGRVLAPGGRRARDRVRDLQAGHRLDPDAQGAAQRPVPLPPLGVCPQ